MSIHRTTLTINDEDVDVTVHYTKTKACPGNTDGKYGPKLEPDEPNHLDIDCIETETGEISPEPYREMLELEIAEAITPEWCD